MKSLILKEMFTKLYDGDIDEAANELTSFLSANSKSNTKPEELSQTVRNELYQLEDTRNLQSAYGRFESNDQYKFILQDEMLSAKLDNITAELQVDPEFMSKNPTYDDFFEEGGKRTLDWIGTMTNRNVTTPQPNQVNALKQRKGEGIQAMTVRRSAPSEPKPRTRDEILSEIAAKRGQNL